MNTRKLKDTSPYTEARIKAGMIHQLENTTYDKISITSIAQEAGISRTTFYMFYGSKRSCSTRSATPSLILISRA